VILIDPRDSGLAECLPYRLVQAVSDSYLVPVGATLATETFDIYSNDGPVDG
jgi:hypothetical protein